jgi:hypothetical protein
LPKQAGPAIPNTPDDAEINLDAPESDLVEPVKKVETTPDEPVKTEEASPPATDDASASFDLPEEKVETPTTPVDKPAAEATPAIPPGPRNYSEYPTELHPLLKTLNNKGFAEFAPKIKEWQAAAAKAKELETQLASKNGGPQFFYEHPEAYQVLPEYRELQQRSGLVEFEQEFWQDQLIRIKQGQEWYTIKGYSQDGQPVYEKRAPLAEGKIDVQAEVMVQNALQNVALERNRVQGGLASLQQSWNGAAQRAQQELAEIDKRLFPKLQGEIPPEEKKLYDLATKIAPQYFRGHPLVDKLGKSFVMYNRLAGRLTGAMKEIERLKLELGNRKVAEPTRVPAGGGNGKVSKDDEIIDIEKLND